MKKRISDLKKKRNAVILAHAYQRKEIQEIADYIGDSLDLSRKAMKTDADFIGGTGDLCRYAQHETTAEFIVGTEDGTIHALEKENPKKTFYPVNTICDGMKKINLKKVVLALEQIQQRVSVPEDIRDKARTALTNMLQVRKTKNHDN